MSSSDAYDYELPRELIAQHPLASRADARLLVVNRSTSSWQHAYVRDLPELLSPADVIVLNDTRVVPARLVGYRTATGGRWSGLFVHADKNGNWQILSKTRGKITAGETVTLQDRETNDREVLTMISALGDGMWVARAESTDSHLEILGRVGHVPLPPYIRSGEMTARDLADYQTVFAERPGAIAAPTAGLHFTSHLLAELESRGVSRSHVTLHVGVGTFRPLGAGAIEEHVMHSEWADVADSTIQQLANARAGGGRVIAIGTTVARTLETAAQRDPSTGWTGETDLYIYPPYEFRAVDGLLTNFHLPRTTLLVLVSAFGGGELIRSAYQEAIREGYRFYSYGDAMLIL